MGNPSNRVLLLATALAALLACSSGEETPRLDTPPSLAPGWERSAGFAGSASCVDCHEEAYKAWSGSHHDLAMQVASEDTVLGDFDDTTFTHFGVTSRFYERDGGFFVQTEGPDGQPTEYEILYTFGVENLQQYLIGLPGGRLQALGIAWDTRPTEQGGGRWFHLYPDERIAPGDPLHWTGRYQVWNAMCAECHSTNLEERYDPDSDSYATTWDEIDVSCETCHGPGKAHVEWAEEATRLGIPASGHHRLLVDFKTGDSRYEVDVCAPCHSRRHLVSGEDRAGRPFLDDFMPVTLREDLYHADGQVLEEVYVYGSFLQSRMYHRGVRCVDCHDPHSLQLLAPGNALCVRCHNEAPDPRFPTMILRNYDRPEHHFHPAGKPGTECVDCHMPATTYMVVDPRRDHSLKVPRPDLSVKLGTPNACSGCHADQPAQWSADWVVKWYGPERRRDPHFAEAIAAGRAGDPAAFEPLVALAGDEEEPAIVRATALELLSQYGPAALDSLAAATRDEEPLLRATAAARLVRLPPEQRLAAMPLLEDPVRAVRDRGGAGAGGVARRSLRPRPAPRLRGGARRVPGGPAGDGGHARRPSEPGRAPRQPRRTRGGGESLLGGASDGSRLPSRPRQPGESLQPHGPKRCRRTPAPGRNRAGRRTTESSTTPSASFWPRRSASRRRRTPWAGRQSCCPTGRACTTTTGWHSNSWVSRTEAGAALRKARRIDPRDSTIAYALAVFYAQQGQWELALPHARDLIALAPGEPEPLQLLRSIEEQLAAERSNR